MAVVSIKKVAIDNGISFLDSCGSDELRFDFVGWGTKGCRDERLRRSETIVDLGLIILLDMTAKPGPWPLAGCQAFLISDTLTDL